MHRVSQQPLIGPHLIGLIETEIAILASEYVRVPGLILTEDDLKCQLFTRILRLPGMDQTYQTADEGILASPVHAEVPWFDEKNKLRLRPDIIITDPAYLSIRHAMQPDIPLPRKGYHFIGDSVLVELKYYRGKSGILPRSVPHIRSDVVKIRRLMARARRLSSAANIYGIVAVFSKYPDRCDELLRLADEIAADQAIKLIITSSIASGDVPNIRKGPPSI